MKTTPYPFQRIGARRIRDLGGRVILADSVGLGKTPQTLLYTDRYLSRETPGPIVAVVPSHLKANWEREVWKHLGQRVSILDGQRVPWSQQRPYDPNGIIVLNYEILHPPKWKPRSKPVDDSWIQWLANLKPRLLIADEAQRLKSTHAACTRAFRWLSRHVPDVLLLTATPLANSPRDLFSLLNILDSNNFYSEWDFNREYTNARKNPWGWEFSGARNLDQLNRVLQNYMIRRRREDVLSELPAVQHEIIYLTVDLRAYTAAEDDFLGWVMANAPHLTNGAVRATQLTKMNYLKQLAGQLKLDAVTEWATDLIGDTGGKLLLGIHHHATSDKLSTAFEKCKFRPVVVDGRIGWAEKDRLCEQFNNDPMTRICLGNIQSAGTGWSCRATSDIGFIEFPWRPDELEQFIGRIDGIGRGLPGHHAHIRYLVAAGTIDEDMCRVLQTKSNWAARAIDGIDVGGGLDIYDLVRERMRQRRQNPTSVI